MSITGSNDTVSAFWDYGTGPATRKEGAGELANQLRTTASAYGKVVSMKVYFPIHGTGSIEEMRNRDKDLVDLSMAGIVSVHCPYSVVGTMAVDVCSSIPANQTAQLPHYGPIPTNWNGSLTFPSNKVVIVTKSNDFAYLVSSLRNKDIAVILLTAEDAHVHLVARATEKKVWKNFFEAPNSRVKDF